MLGFNHSPAIKKVITVYKDWIYMNVPELPPFLLEPLPSQQSIENDDSKYDNMLEGKFHDPLAGS